MSYIQLIIEGFILQLIDSIYDIYIKELSIIENAELLKKVLQQINDICLSTMLDVKKYIEDNDIHIEYYEDSENKDIQKIQKDAIDKVHKIVCNLIELNNLLYPEKEVKFIKLTNVFFNMNNSDRLKSLIFEMFNEIIGTCNFGDKTEYNHYKDIVNKMIPGAPRRKDRWENKL